MHRKAFLNPHLSPHLGQVERVRVSLEGIAGVRQVEVQGRLLQHLLIPVLVVLPVGREAAVVAPVFFDGNLEGHRFSSSSGC